MSQNNVLAMVLGGMFIDTKFRTAMIEDVNKALSAYEIPLDRNRQVSAGKMVRSFANGNFDRCIGRVRMLCKNWPCRGFVFEDPGAEKKAGPKAKKAVRKRKTPARRR